MLNISIIDYQMSNMFSVKNALDKIGFKSEITSNYKTLLNSDGAILPGVGSFPQAIKQLKKLDLIYPIVDFVNSSKPFIGICLGLQLLFEESEEYGYTNGLGIVKGSVKSLKNYVKLTRVPHVGWNSIEINNKSFNHPPSFFNNINERDKFYFVHSYFVMPNNKKNILTNTIINKYKFCSSILDNNLFGCQFHPEKSGIKGLNIFKNFFIR